MGIFTNHKSGSKASDKGGQVSLINNRCSGPSITSNRRVLFKQFNYQFRLKKFEPIAS